MTRSPTRSNPDPQAGAKPVPRVSRAKLTARVLWLTEIAQALLVRQLNLEAVISHAPGVRRVLRQMPRNVKAQAPEVVPFDARLWSRGDPEERSRFATAVAWFRDHPGSTVGEAARRCRVNPNSLRATPAMRELRLTRPSTTAWTGHTGGAQRALRYLARHRPASVAEVARAVGVTPAVLQRNVRFRKAWETYARTATLQPSARRLLGRPAARRKEDRPVRRPARARPSVSLEHP